MSRLVDGEVVEVPTHCRCGAPAADARDIGAQETATKGDYLLLATCRSCETTFVQGGVSGATPCCGCGDLVLGDCEDPKCCFVDVHGTPRVACMACAASLRLLDGPPPVPSGPPRFLTLAEVREAQGGAL